MKELWKEYRGQLLLCLFSVFVGCIVGAIDAVFGRGLAFLTKFRESYGCWFLLGLPFAAAGIAWVYKNYGGKCNKGMKLVFEAEEGKEKHIPLLLIPLATVATWLTHLFGGSAGREGVAIQIGATVSNWFADKLPVENASAYLIPIGMAAGFGGLFQTPITAILFAAEVLVAGEIRYPAFLPSLFAALSAAYTSSFLGLASSALPMDISMSLTPLCIVQCILLGLIFGFAGNLFSILMHKGQQFTARLFPSPVRKALVVGTITMLCLFLFHQGRYSGSGANLIGYALHGEKIYAYDWLLKMVLTIMTMASGLMGGEVVPLFTVGATLGACVAPCLGLPAAFGAMLGYSGVFCAGTNTFFAAVFVGCEVFGFQYLPFFFTVCTVAYVFNQNHSIYGLQKVLFKKQQTSE